jgi:uncharacterized protein YoxC
METVETVWQLAFIVGLVGFGIWFSHLTHKLNSGLSDLQGRGDDLDEIREAVDLVAGILQQLPQLMPQFHMPSQSPLAPLIEMFMKNMQGQGSSAVDPQRDALGRFTDATTTQNEENTPEVHGD